MYFIYFFLFSKKTKILSRYITINISEYSYKILLIVFFKNS